MSRPVVRICETRAGQQAQLGTVYMDKKARRAFGTLYESSPAPAQAMALAVPPAYKDLDNPVLRLRSPHRRPSECT